MSGGIHDHRPLRPRRSPEAQAFIESLDDDDVRMLKLVIATFRNLDAWCRVTRWLLLGALGLLILLSQGLDAIKNLLNWKN